jgi:hypothetical protein
MDLKKAMDAAMIPAAILTAIGIVSALIGAIPVLNMLLCILGLPILIVNLAVLGWSGFRAVKEYGMDLVGGAVVGAMAGLASALIGGIVQFLLNMLGLGAAVMGSGDAIGGAVGVVGGIIGLIFGVIFGTIFGAILGAVGAFVAGMKK